MLNKKKDSLKPQELSTFCTEIALMLNAGMTMFDGVESLAETGADSTQSGMYSLLGEHVKQTGSLAEALKADDRWPAYLQEMALVGERSGRLEDTMNGLAVYYERQGRIRQAIAGAVAYPVVLGVMMLLIVLVLVLKIIPVFDKVLGSMGITMTAPAMAMMQVGSTVGWAVFAVVLLIVLAVLTCAVLMRTGMRNQALDALSRLFPPFRNLRRRVAASRAASVISMMVSSGFSIQDALEMVPGVLDSSESIEKVRAISHKLENGESFGAAVKESGLFEPVHAQMIQMGIHAGRGDEVLAKVAALYEEQTEESIAGLVAIIEPTLVAVLSAVIGAVLLAVMLPMAGLIASLV